MVAPAIQEKTEKLTAQWRDPLGILWKFLLRSWLLILLGVLALLLILSALFVPQLPSHLADNPAEASRWIATATEQMGIGSIIATMGLFDVLHSTLLRLLIVLIGLTLAIHFADMLGVAVHQYRLPKRLDSAPLPDGQFIDLASPTPLYRQQSGLTQQTNAEADSLRSRLESHFDEIIETDITSNSDIEDKNESESEKRILARRHSLFAFLRPLLMLGLLLSIVPVWNIIVYGWELSPDPLGPGDQIRYEVKELEMRYEILPTSADSSPSSTAESETLSTQLVVQIGENEQLFPIEESLRTTINQVEIRAAIGPPALRISLPDGQARLALPGQSTASSSVGLVFPSVGNEKFVLLPTQAMGLRIVRGQDEDGTYFLFEVLDQSDAEPIQREEITEGNSQIIELAMGNTVLQIDSLPGLAVSARYLPDIWLFIPAFLLVLIGAVGYWRRPGFVFAQLFPRGAEQSLSLYQANSINTLAAISDDPQEEA